jgi:ABC-2 type transport system ATP-binding protein
MIHVDDLTKRYGDTLAVDGLSFEVRPGRVTGFLGPNGAGKSTTIRTIVGLDAPTAGRATVNGRRYGELRAPLHEVGVLLDARGVHGGRTAFNHLWWLAQSNGIPRRRVGEALEMVGLGDSGGQRVRGFSLGMGQRLGIAAALLGDPATLILDEPVNGLDTEGIRWVRDLMKALAGEGRTVFVSSHLMSEMQLAADHLIVIGRGRLLADMPTREFIERNSETVTVVRSPQPSALRAVLEGSGARVDRDAGGRWRVTGMQASVVGDLAARHGIGLHELTPAYSSLEEVFTRMTHASVEYRATPSPAREEERIR